MSFFSIFEKTSIFNKIVENPIWRQVNKERTDLVDIAYNHWVTYNMFTLVWWLQLALFISIWFIWWKKVYKDRLLEIVTFGVLVSLMATFIDTIGTETMLWSYPNVLIPFVPQVFIVNQGMLPVTYMLVYQYFPEWKRFIPVIFIIAVMFSFVGEPIAVWLGIYQLLKWKYIYSFPIYLALAFLLKSLMEKINFTQKRAGS